MEVISSPATLTMPERRHVEPAQQVQQRRLARAARAHEGDELAALHVEVEALEHVDLLAAARGSVLSRFRALISGSAPRLLSALAIPKSRTCGEGRWPRGSWRLYHCGRHDA